MICVVLQKSRSLMLQIEGMLHATNSRMEIHGFLDISSAQRFMLQESCDLVIVDPNFQTWSCMELVREWMRNKPKLNVIFITDSREYMQEAFSLFVSDYIVTPFAQDRLEQSLAHLRYPITAPMPSKKVSVRCFGNFEIYINGKSVNFHYSKTKELLAYLIDRQGAMLSNAEISAVLWEEQNHQAYFKSIRKDLLDTLALQHCDGIIALQRGKLGVNMDLVDCDYYNWLKNPAWGNDYYGEYMSQYTWSESTNGRLTTMLRQQQSVLI